MKRAFACIKLFLVFLVEFVIANLSVLQIILFKRSSKIHPQIVDFPVPELNSREILLLAQMITLTPGTLSCVIDTENKSIKIHILDSVDADTVLASIDKKFKRAILEVTQ